MPVGLEICLITAFSQHLWRSDVSLLADVSLFCSYIGEQKSDFNHTALFGALCKNPHTSHADDEVLNFACYILYTEARELLATLLHDRRSAALDRHEMLAIVQDVLEMILRE